MGSEWGERGETEQRRSAKVMDWVKKEELEKKRTGEIVQQDGRVLEKHTVETQCQIMAALVNISCRDQNFSKIRQYFLQNLLFLLLQSC